MLKGIGNSIGHKCCPSEVALDLSESADASMMHTSQVTQAIASNIIDNRLHAI